VRAVAAARAARRAALKPYRKSAHDRGHTTGHDSVTTAEAAEPRTKQPGSPAKQPGSGGGRSLRHSGTQAGRGRSILARHKARHQGLAPQG
jgi:hypothetical protein